MPKYQAALYLPMTVVYGRLCNFGLYGNYRTFRCKESEVCCRDDCCEAHAEIYTLWYFWLALFLLLLLILGLSYIAWRRRLKQRRQCSINNNQRPSVGTTEYLQVSTCTSPPPYKHSPPPYTSVETIYPPPPYQEKQTNCRL